MNSISESYRNCEWLIKKHAPLIFRAQAGTESSRAAMQEAIKASGRVPQNKARSQRSAGPSEVRKFIRMYKAGHTMYRIAVLCKRDPATVRWALIREGVRQA